MNSLQRLSPVFRDRCVERGCRTPVYRADRCSLHYEQYKAARERITAERRSLPQTPSWQSTECFVYAVRSSNGLIKIGSAREPRERVRYLQGQSPVVVSLSLLGQISGSQAMERMIHRRLKKWRVHGEWFHESEPVAAVVAAIQSGSRLELQKALAITQPPC